MKVVISCCAALVVVTVVVCLYHSSSTKQFRTIAFVGTNNVLLSDESNTTKGREETVAVSAILVADTVEIPTRPTAFHNDDYVDYDDEQRKQKFESIRQYRLNHTIVNTLDTTTTTTTTTRTTTATTSIRQKRRGLWDISTMFSWVWTKNSGTRYTLIDASDIATTLKGFQTQYPKLISVSTGQEEFNLPTSYENSITDCPYDTNTKGCLNYFAIIYDSIAHPIGTDSYKRLPTILLSGALHGNERVGPTTVIETTRILLRATQCESYNKNNTVKAQYTMCKRSLLTTYGINDEQRMWLARLVSTRRIIIVPTANAVGYYKNVREENGIDMNRDFPYDLTDPKLCMRTIGARVLNELYRSYIIQMSLTYHAGTECIAYEWGATSWIGYYSPDDIGQNRICSSLRQYAGKFGITPYYVIGPSNDIVYDVRGGMEDWAYAGSWDPKRVLQCTPTTYGGYPKTQTTYSLADLRVFNILVETSNIKAPIGPVLGTNKDILDPTSVGNGHVPRNIRVSLLTAELVEPYITIQSINSVVRTHDIIPLQRRTTTSCRSTSNIVSVSVASISRNNNIIKVRWIVGGALVINKTNMWHSKWDTVTSSSFNCLSQPTVSITNQMNSGTMLTRSKGVGRYTVSGTATVFESTFNIKTSEYTIGDEIIVLINAQVDQKWKTIVDNTLPTIPPQSHMVNVRTNNSWYYTNRNKFYVQGRTLWYSIPLTIKLVP